MITAINPECKFAPPALEVALARVEQELGVAVPDELLGLWRESNGIEDDFGDGVWSAEETIRQNLELRSDPEENDLYMPFEPMFCFAGAGNGDLFFFPVQAGGIHRADVFLWEHETDSRVWKANNLQKFVEQWYSGDMPDSDD